MIDIVFLCQKKLGRDCLKVVYDMPDANILGVVTKEHFEKVWWNPYVERFCIKNKIPFYSVSDILFFKNVDILISVLNPYILSSDVINKARIAINLHAAPLPEYRGCNEAMWAIANKEKYFGATLHVLSEGIDRGDIIEKRTFEIGRRNAKQLYDYTSKVCLQIFKDNIESILDGDFSAVPQDTSIESHCYKRNELPDESLGLRWW